jgi:hypothetical protein
MSHGKLQVFSADGNFSRGIRISHTDSPCGVVVDGNVVYVTDSKKRQLNMYNICEHEAAS